MLGIIKNGDLRYEYLNEIYKDSVYSSNLLDFYEIDTLLLPLNGIDNLLFIKDTDLNLMDFLGTKNLKNIICFKENKELRKFSNENKLNLYVLENDFNYMYKNSLLTAEGLHKVILDDIASESLFDKSMLILGYGYEGKALKRYFKNLTNLKIYARDPHDIKELKSNGLYQEFRDFSKYDIIINTIPFPILKKDEIDTFKESGLFYEIASYPYGFDIDYMKIKKLKFKNLPKIPGRYKVYSSAKILKDFICQNLVDSLDFKE